MEGINQMSLEINKIHLGNNIDLIKQLEDNSVDLIITSPPYNKGYWSDNQQMNNGFNTKSRKIEYGSFNDCLEPSVYEQQQKDLIEECLRVLKPTGSFFYNHIDILHHHQTIHPKYVYDFPLKQTIIWNRSNTPRLDKSYFFPITEYLFWFQKTKDSRAKFDRSQCGFQKNVWEISPDGSNKHPAPFPLSIVENIILATTNEGDLVLDPYMGSGTTALGAFNLKRKYIGFEFVEDFVKMANERIERANISLF
jgi:site-specific DNA-methyltransferase (adenine-specific)